MDYLQGPKPCHRYRAKLKSKIKNLSNEFWKTSKNLFEENRRPDLSYSPLVLDTQESPSQSKIQKYKSKMSQTNNLRTYFSENKPEISPADLLKTDQDILLVGKPGIGKTTLVGEMLRLWAEKDNKELDYMFYFDMRETSQISPAKTLKELLFSVFSEPDEGMDEVLQDIKSNSHNVTIIFDGVTDVSSSVVQKLVKKDLLPYAKIIITCRPDDEEDFFPEDCLRVEVKGFSEQTVKSYLSATLGEAQMVLNNLELLTLCHVPMYALMVAACFSSEDMQPCTITEIYIDIVRYCLQVNSSKTKTKDLNAFIKTKREEILSLAEVAFLATQEKTVNLNEVSCKDNCVLCFLKPLFIKVGRTDTETRHAFLHYTLQEFFAAVWLLKNPDEIRKVFQQNLTEEKKHMKHLIPFMCGLLNKSPKLMRHLIPAEELNKTSDWFFKELITTFVPDLSQPDVVDGENFGSNVDVMFLSQCLYESQCPDACIYLLDKLDYHVDLSGESLDPHCCCAVAYVVSQSKERKIRLNLEDVSISERGMRSLFGCLHKVQWSDCLPQQLWKIFLLSEEQMDYTALLNLKEMKNQMHLPVEGEKQLFERAAEVMKRMTTKVRVCLHWNRETPVSQSLFESILDSLPFISSLSVVPLWSDPDKQTRFFGNLFCAAANKEQQTGEKILELLSSVCCYETFPYDARSIDDECRCDFLLDLFSHVKDCETKTGLRVLPSLQSVFQSTPPVWIIDLSERKSSILLEMLKLQSEKKQIRLRGCSDEESDVRSFLQCLPYISQLSFLHLKSGLGEQIRFFGNLFCAAAEREHQTGEKILELLSSVCRYSSETLPFSDLYNHSFDDDSIEEVCHTLQDLFSHVKDCETKTDLSVLPSLQSVFQSTPPVWIIDLSERKTSILLEVLKLQSEKKQVELTGWSDEDSEVRSFLQCLPYISQLRFVPRKPGLGKQTRFLGNLFCAAAEREHQTGEKILELLASVCSFETLLLSSRYIHGFCNEKICNVLLDLCSHVKDCETRTGLRVLPSLQSVFQSTPPFWIIDLSKRKTSILLEMLKLQSEKKQVFLTGWSDEESEVRSFLQCLPYISQLSVSRWSVCGDFNRFFGNLFCAAAEREHQTGEKILELLLSVCNDKTFSFSDTSMDYDDDDIEFQCKALLDLFSHVKNFETKTGLRVLPSLQSVFQSGPPVWIINLSKRKSSILLEMLKLQSEKKQVRLTGCSDEESEVRSFLQCLPYISQLSISLWSIDGDLTRFFGNLFCAAAEREHQTGEKILELLSSVCNDKTFSFSDTSMDYDDDDVEYQCNVLLDLCSHVKDCETRTGLRVLPSLQSVFQSTPPVWIIDLSERKTSILLEMLKLQSEKKQIRLRGCSDEESDVRSFLQCLPYISQLSCDPDFFQCVCSSISVRSRQEVHQLESLLQLLDFKLLLTGKLSRRTCCSVGRVLQRCGSRVDLSLTAEKMSVRRTFLLFRNTTHLHSLKLSNAMVLLLFLWVRRGRPSHPLTVEKLSLEPQTLQPSERLMLKVVSSLSSLLRSCSVRELDLTESCIPVQCLIPLLLHDGPLTLKLSGDYLLQLLVLLHEVQDQDLTLSSLMKVGGDLTSCSLNWDLLHYLLQNSPSQTFTVNLRKNRCLQESAARLLPFLDRIVFKRPSPSFVMTSIRELHRVQASHMVPSLLRSLDHVINLSCRELDSVDSAALLFTLRHSDGVKLDLRWTSIPEEGTRSILSTLDRVSQLSVDRNQLLRFIHCCASCDGQQEAASVLLRTLQQRLDLSCGSCVDLPEEDQTLSLTADDCRAASMVLKHCRDTELHLQDCEVEDAGLDLLFSVLDRVRLRVSKSVLLQLLSLIPVHSERDTVRRAQSLCGALGGELDLSHNPLDQRVCGGLVQMLDSCEGLTELDLSHCQLSDQLLLPLIPHLHKVQVLDLSHNQITDASTDVLLQLISTHSSIHTVRLFSNNIMNRKPFKKHKQVEMW